MKLCRLSPSLPPPLQVLKDPGKPQGKGNFWAVELNRVPLELLKRQNTAVSRQDETVFAQDLAPYILHGHKPEEGPPLPLPEPPPPEDPYRPKLDSSFAIDSLLHSLRPVSAAGEGERGRDPWGEHPYPQTNPHPHPHPPHPRFSSSSSSSFVRRASASSASPASSSSSSSSSSDEDWRAPVLPRQEGKRGAPGEPAIGGYEDCRPPPRKTSRRSAVAPPWELPTSYAKYAPPNVVAPPSMRFNGGPSFLPLGGLPFYSYRGPPAGGGGHFMSHAYWSLLPGGRVPLQAPPLLMDLDSLLQSVPPNKSVFDVLGPSSQPPHPSQGQYGLQSAPPLSRYPQY